MEAGVTELDHAIWWLGFSHAQNSNIRSKPFKMHISANDIHVSPPSGFSQHLEKRANSLPGPGAARPPFFTSPCIQPPGPLTPPGLVHLHTTAQQDPPAHQSPCCFPRVPASRSAAHTTPQPHLHLPALCPPCNQSIITV